MRLETQAAFNEHRKLFTSLHEYRGWFIFMAIEKRSDAVQAVSWVLFLMPPENCI